MANGGYRKVRMFKLIKRGALLVVLLFLVFLVIGVVVATRSPQRAVSLPPAPAALPTPAPAKPKWSPTSQEVDARAKLIDKLQSQGIFGDLRVANHVGKAVVGPAFYGCEFKARQDFASAAMAWCADHDPDVEVLTLLDYQTNAEVGRFAEVYGGLKWEGKR